MTDERIEKLKEDLRKISTALVKKCVEWDSYRALKDHPKATQKDLKDCIEKYCEEQRLLTELCISDAVSLLDKNYRIYRGAAMEMLESAINNIGTILGTYDHTLIEFMHNGYSDLLAEMNKTLDAKYNN